MSQDPNPDELKVLQPSDADVARALRQLGYSFSEKTETGSPDGEVDPEAMQALDIRTHDPEHIETIPLPEDAAEQMRPPEKERVRHAGDGIFSGEEVAAPDKDPWSRNIPTLGRVSVTELELEEYTRALLHDTRFELDIPMMIGDQPFIVRVRSLTMSEREVTAVATSRIADSYPIKDLARAAIIADFSFKAAAAIQVVSVDGLSQNPFDATLAEGELVENSPKVDELIGIIRTRYANTHQHRLRMLLNAVHTFEVKQRILEDGYDNRDFPRPGGAS